MSANDEFDRNEASSASAETSPAGSQNVPTPIELSAGAPTEAHAHEDDSWMDVHTLNFVPPKRIITFTAKITHCGRGTPSCYPDPLGDRDDNESDE